MTNHIHFPASLRHLTFILAAACLLAGCRLTERITHTRSIQVDTVRHHVPLPGHILQAPIMPADSITLEDERLKITLWRPPRAALPADGAPPAARRLHVPGTAAPPDTGAAGWQIRAEIKPDTVQVQVPQRTITEKKETTKYVKQTPDLVKYLIGGMAAIILLLVAAWRLRT